MTRKILNLVPYCNSLIPGDHTTDNAFGFNVQSRTQIGQDLSCYARGITSQITGSHAEYLVFDDVESRCLCSLELSAGRQLGRWALHMELEHV